MYYKINNPTKSSATVLFAVACAMGAFFLFLTLLFLWMGGWNVAVFLKTFTNFIKEAFADSVVTGLIALVLTVGLPLFVVFSIFNFFKNRRKWRARDFVQGIDFQPSHLILVSGEPVALAYDETTLKLDIRIQLVHRGKNNYVPEVTKLVFHFSPSAAEKTENAPQIKLEHKGNMDDIFPLLDFQPLLKNFSYKFQVDGSRNDLEKYRAFVDEQIQNQLAYGVHLPFDGWGAVGRGMLLLLFAGFTVFCAYALYAVFTDNGGPALAVLFGLMLCGFSATAWHTFKRLRHYFTARSIINRHKGN